MSCGIARHVGEMAPAGKECRVCGMRVYWCGVLMQVGAMGVCWGLGVQSYGLGIVLGLGS
jgi:hypothetical protein